MVFLPKQTPHDLTLQRAEIAIVENENSKPRRKYLGMSSIGGACSRKLWYSYHTPMTETFDAPTIMRFEDGHRSEALIADRLKATPGIMLLTEDDNGRQFGVEDFEGQFRGHLDGKILGLVHAPSVWHVWEAKCTNLKKFMQFKTLKADLGEQNALKQWDATYYAQAQSYMGYTGLDDHYLTVCTPGGRDWEAVCTRFNEVDFEAIRDKAHRILGAMAPLARLSNDPSWYECKWCFYKDHCHGIAKLSA
jgi:hypothetical protein